MSTLSVLQTRHFNTIADALKMARLKSPHRHSKLEFDEVYLPAIADYLAMTNSRFDRKWFIEHVTESDQH